MDIYKYIAENEEVRYIFYFTFSISESFFLSLIYNEVSKDTTIYDIFPEPHTEDITLKEPLSVRTRDGSEMFLPVDTKIKVLSTFRVLFGINEDG